MVLHTALGCQCWVDAASRCRARGPIGGDRLIGSSSSLGLSLFLLLLLNLFRVAVEEHVDHDVPAVGRAGDGAAETEDLTAEEPPHEADRVAGLVVRRDGDVDEFEWRVGIAEGDDGDVDVRRLADRLVVDARVSDDDQAGLLERAGDVVGEASGGEAAGDRLGTGVGGVLEDRTVAVRAGRNDTDVVRVLDSGNDTGGENELLPGLADVDDVDA